MSCCPRRRSTAKRTGHGGCTVDSASPTSFVATTSRAIRGRSRSWVARCPCNASRCAPTALRTGRWQCFAPALLVAAPRRHWCRIWHDDLVPTRPRTRKRLLALVLLLLVVAPTLIGCVRIRASITVSPDDRVSGQIVAAAKSRATTTTRDRSYSTTCRSRRRSPSPSTAATTTSDPRRCSPT